MSLLERAEKFRGKRDRLIGDFGSYVANIPDYSARYPNGVDLSPDSEEHGELLTTLFNYGNNFRTKMAQRYRTWQKLDEALSTYIELTDDELDMINKDVTLKEGAVAAVLPYLAMQLETWITYWVEAFLERPYIPLSPVSPEDIVGTLLLEKVLDQQCLRDRSGLQLYIAFKDMFIYGLGGVHLTFLRDKRLRTAYVEDGAGVGQRVTKRDVLKEGNIIRAIDPYQLILDANTPFIEYQRGEYIGWVERTNRMQLLGLEANDKTHFNAAYLSALKDNGYSELFNPAATGGARTKYEYTTTIPGMIDGIGERNPNTMDVQHMYANIIPAEWGFSARKSPEKWYFSIVGDRVITSAKPQKYDHERYPCIIGSPDVDGHTTVQVSKLEMHHPVQEWINWLLRSRQANVRKCINGFTIYDPSFLDADKMQKAEAGKLLAINEEGWGRDVRTMVHNVDVPDVTAGHMNDVSAMISLTDITSGATPSVRGELQLGERVTRYQAQSARSSSLRRIERGAKIMALMFRCELGEQMIANTQQWITQSTWVKVVGTDEEKLLAATQSTRRPGQLYKVEPQDLMIGADVSVSEGSILGMENIAELLQALQLMLTDEELHNRFDVGRFFAYIMHRSGVKNITDFERAAITPQASPESQMPTLGGQGAASQTPSAAV